MPSPDQVEIPRRAKDAFREHGRGFVVILKRARTLDSKPPSFLVEVLPRVGTQWELRPILALRDQPFAIAFPLHVQISAHSGAQRFSGVAFFTPD